jgi:hypothetical protein
MSLEFEINILKHKNLLSLMPTYLWTYFKVEFNDRILANLINELNNLVDNHTDDINQIIDGIEVVFRRYYESIRGFLNIIDSQTKVSYQICNKLHGLPTNEEISSYQRAILTQNLLSKHYDLLSILFRKIFDIHNAANNQQINNMENNDESSTCKYNQLTDKFHAINKYLFELNLFDHLCSDIIVEVVQNKIKDHIENTSIDNYQESFISVFEQWLDHIVIGWIRLIYSSSNVDLNNTTDSFDQYLFNYKKQLAHFMYSHYARCRINRLFDIIVDYPDSKNAVDDLKICLQKTNLRSIVIKSLKTSIEQRLLHPGVNTSDILTAYVSAIKALMILDPSGVMLGILFCFNA